MHTQLLPQVSMPWWRPIWRLLQKIVTLYLLVVVLLAALQRKLLYFPTVEESLPVTNFRIVTDMFPAAEDVEITCNDKVRIRGWLLRKQAGDSGLPPTGRQLVLYFHGNGGNRSGRTGWYELLAKLDVDILAIDYHGYGDSEGSMSEEALELDCDATWNHAVNALGYRPDNIYIVGTSLGGAAAVYLSSEQCRSGTPPGGLAVVATFSSMVDAGKTHYPWLPVNLILVDRYPSEDRITEVTCPVLILHGDVDRVVPQQFGRKLFDRAPDQSVNGLAKRWVDLPGIGHNDLIYSAAERIEQELGDHLQSIRNTRSQQP